MTYRFQATRPCTFIPELTLIKTNQFSITYYLYNISISYYLYIISISMSHYIYNISIIISRYKIRTNIPLGHISQYIFEFKSQLLFFHLRQKENKEQPQQYQTSLCKQFMLGQARFALCFKQDNYVHSAVEHNLHEVQCCR